LVLVNPPKYTLSLNKGLLADVAPTILRLLELNKPDEMTGVSLISEKSTP
jgi:bisphosphoglycerate-independent phosphoglycerate mutase (AlkP superfamily)